MFLSLPGSRLEAEVTGKKANRVGEQIGSPL